MRRIVITPTFRPHFPYNREFLETYRDHVEDAAEIPVHFVVSRGELADMEAILRDFPGLALHAHAIEDLLAESGHQIDDVGALLAEIGKFAFQAIKKLYALKSLDYDQALVIDSESMVLKPVRLGATFDEYFAAPFVFYSDLSHRGEKWFGSLSDTVTLNAGKLLRTPALPMYLLEYYGWYYEKQIVHDLFAAIPDDLLPAIRHRLGRDRAVFENVLYYSFVYANRTQYGYTYVSVNDMLREYLGENGYAEYVGNFTGIWEPFGIFEYVSKEVTDRNVGDLARLFRDRNLRFYRSELWNRNERAQSRLIDESPITFLVSSENYRRIRERVAVCLSGLPRQYRQNLKLLRTFLADTSADVFFHFWESPEQDFIVQSLEPKAYAFERNQLTPDFTRFKRRERFAPPERDRGSVAMFYSIYRANELKRAYEAEHGFTYDIVVRLRLDLYSLASLSDMLDRIRLLQRGWERTLYVPDMAQSVGLNDQIAVGSSATLDAYASAYCGLEPFAATHYFNPEYYLLRHVLAQGLDLQTFPLEYVLLRDEKIDTFDLAPLIRDTQQTWWSAKLPRIAAQMLPDYFRAKADSVETVAELELESPKVFRLRAGDHGFLRLDPEARAITYAQAVPDASVFFLIIAGEQDRTAVNIRCRDLALANQVTAITGVTGWNLYTDVRGTVHPDGPADARSAFYVARRGDELRFEWRAGFWTTPSDALADETDDVPPDVRRLFLVADARGLRLEPGPDRATAFTAEYVRDETAEASQLGMHVAVDSAPPVSSDPLLVRLMWRSYVATRFLARHGMTETVSMTTRFLRRRAHEARRASGDRAEAGLVNRTINRVRGRG